MTRKHGHWGTSEEAKQWATRARRRAEVAEVREQLDDEVGPSAAAAGD